jgi:uncharacterized protein (DUF2062 family)
VENRLFGSGVALADSIPPVRVSRVRRLKQFLRLMPRRARLHQYPLIGRFAPQLRQRSYLWSFRRRHVRSACYSGSILAFLPLFGIQLPLALIAALLLRTNFMVLGGLQFITNPISAAPVYFATYHLGNAVLETVFGSSVDHSERSDLELVQLGGFVAESLVEPIVPADSAPTPAPWRIRDGILAMVVGGVLIGVVVGAVLDLIDRLVRRDRRCIPPDS